MAARGTPTPMPIFADWGRPEAEAAGVAVGGDVVMAVCEVGAMEEEVEGVEGPEEGALVELLASMLLTSALERRIDPGVSPNWFWQHVVFASVFVRGQKLPSEQALSCTE